MFESSEDTFAGDVVTAATDMSEEQTSHSGVDGAADAEVSKHVDDYSGWRRFRRSASRSII